MKDGVKYFDYETRGVGEYADHFLALTDAGEAFFDGLHAKAEETRSSIYRCSALRYRTHMRQLAVT